MATVPRRRPPRWRRRYVSSSHLANSRRVGGSPATAAVSSHRRELALERQPGLLPVQQPARVAADVPIAASNQIPIEGDARQTVDPRAVDDDLVVGPDRRVELSGGVEMDRVRDVLDFERPAVERHDQLEVVAPVELRLELFASDRSDRLGAQGGLLMGLVDDRPIIAQLLIHDSSQMRRGDRVSRRTVNVDRLLSVRLPGHEHEARTGLRIFDGQRITRSENGNLRTAGPTSVGAETRTAPKEPSRTRPRFLATPLVCRRAPLCRQPRANARMYQRT